MELVDTKWFKNPPSPRCAGSTGPGHHLFDCYLAGDAQQSCSLKILLKAPLAEWLCSGLQIRGPRFDSGRRLHHSEKPVFFSGWFFRIWRLLFFTCLSAYLLICLSIICLSAYLLNFLSPFICVYLSSVWAPAFTLLSLCFLQLAFVCD